MPLLSRNMTVAQARRALADAFRQAALDSPELDARLLVGHALGLDNTALTIDSGRDRRRKPSLRPRLPRSTAMVLAPARSALPISAPARARFWSPS